MRNNEVVGALIAVAGVFLFSAKAVLVKLCYTYEVDVVTVLMLRMGFALPIFVVMGLLKTEKGKQKLDAKSMLWIISLGVLGYYGASLFDFIGLKYINASLERLILFIYPTIVVVLSAVVLKNPLKPRQLLAILITYMGLSVVFLPALLHQDVQFNAFGVWMIVLSAVTYASYLVASQYFVPKFGTVRFTTAAMIVSCLAVLVHYALDPEASVIGLPVRVYVYGFLMAVFSTVIPAYLISEAINRIGAAKVAIIGSLGPISTISLSILYLGESINSYQVIGGLVIIGGVVWLNLEKQKLS